MDLLKLIIHEILCVQACGHFCEEEVWKYSPDIQRCLNTSLLTPCTALKTEKETQRVPEFTGGPGKCAETLLSRHWSSTVWQGTFISLWLKQGDSCRWPRGDLAASLLGRRSVIPQPTQIREEPYRPVLLGSGDTVQIEEGFKVP